MYLHNFSEVIMSCVLTIFCFQTQESIHVMHCTQTEKKNIGQSAEDNIIGLNKYIVHIYPSQYLYILV